MGNPDVLIVSGAGRYADDWHDFPQTSARLAGIAERLGHAVAITEQVDDALADPADARLLVINIGYPSPALSVATTDAVRRGLEGHVGRGGSLLAVHVSSTSMPDLPQWQQLLGGRWVFGQTMHPPQSEATILRTGHAHPIADGLGDFEVVDERYSYLVTEPDVTVLYEHEHDGLRHPLVWARETGRSRLVYDALGHDTRSYESPGHLALLDNAFGWLLEQRPA